jgi:hypothetical protein
MPDMRGLTLLVATIDADRYHAALSLAAAQAALGGRARVHLQGQSVALLDADRSDIRELQTEAVALGVVVTACQTGLAERSMPLPPNVEADGLIGLLSSLGEDRLLVF